MVRVDYRERRSPSPGVAKVKSRNFSKLQNTQFEPDKADFESYQLAQNVIHKGANARIRRGYENVITDNDILGIHIYEEVNGNQLYATQKDGASNSKIIEIDRSDFSKTDIATGKTGQTAPSMASLNGWFYWVNGGSQYILSYERVSSTTNETLNISADEKPKLITTDESRIWGVFVNTDIGSEILRFSQAAPTGEVTSFSTAGTDIDRGGIGNSLITKFNALVSAGKYIAVAGDNRTEIHRIPDFATNGITTFPADVSTLVWSYPNLGVKSQHGMLAVDDNIYLVPGDGTLVKLNIPTGGKTVFRDNFRSLEKLNTDEAALGYDQKNTLVLISASILSGNDTVVAFNHQEENFSRFTNIYAEQWVQDFDNVYFYNSNTGVFDAFKSTYLDDEGQPIEVKLITQMNDLGDLDIYKTLNRLFFDIEYDEDVSLNVKVYADRPVNGMFSADHETDLTLSSSGVVFDDSNQTFGMGVWGAAAFAVDGDTSTEQVRTNDFVNIEGVRFEVEISCEVSSNFSVRGIGAYYFATARPTNNLTFS